MGQRYKYRHKEYQCENGEYHSSDYAHCERVPETHILAVEQEWYKTEYGGNYSEEGRDYLAVVCLDPIVYVCLHCYWRRWPVTHSGHCVVLAYQVYAGVDDNAGQHYQSCISSLVKGDFEYGECEKKSYHTQWYSELEVICFNI